MSLNNTLTIIVTSLLGLFSYVYIRRNLLSGKKIEELMELNRKLHDITNRADDALSNRVMLSKRDFGRLKYFTRYNKHGRIGRRIVKMVEQYRKLWDELDWKMSGRKYYYTEKEYVNLEKKFTELSFNLRKYADKLVK